MGWNGTLELVLVRHSSEARIALVLPVSIKDCPLLWMVVRSQTYYLEHILAYGSEKARCTLVVGSNSFWTDWLEMGGERWRSKHLTKIGSQVLEAWSPSLDGDLNPMIGVERVGLVYAWGTSEACVSGYLARIHWFMNRRLCEWYQLGYGLAP